MDSGVHITGGLESFAPRRNAPRLGLVQQRRPMLGRRHHRSPLCCVGGIGSGLSGTGDRARGGVHVGHSAACNAGAASSSISACGMGSQPHDRRKQAHFFLRAALSARLGMAFDCGATAAVNPRRPVSSGITRRQALGGSGQNVKAESFTAACSNLFLAASTVRWMVAC